MNYDDIDCPTPSKAQAGDVWYCPGCARKFFCAMVTLEDRDVQFLAWMTTEIE